MHIYIYVYVWYMHICMTWFALLFNIIKMIKLKLLKMIKLCPKVLAAKGVLSWLTARCQCALATFPQKVSGCLFHCKLWKHHNNLYLQISCFNLDAASIFTFSLLPWLTDCFNHQSDVHGIFWSNVVSVLPKEQLCWTETEPLPARKSKSLF